MQAGLRTATLILSAALGATALAPSEAHA